MLKLKCDDINLIITCVCVCVCVNAPRVCSFLLSSVLVQRQQPHTSVEFQRKL